MPSRPVRPCGGSPRPCPGRPCCPAARIRRLVASASPSWSSVSTPTDRRIRPGRLYRGDRGGDSAGDRDVVVLISTVVESESGGGAAAQATACLSSARRPGAPCVQIRQPVPSTVRTWWRVAVGDPRHPLQQVERRPFLISIPAPSRSAGQRRRALRRPRCETTAASRRIAGSSSRNTAAASASPQTTRPADHDVGDRRPLLGHDGWSSVAGADVLGEHGGDHRATASGEESVGEGGSSWESRGDAARRGSRRGRCGPGDRPGDQHRVRGLPPVEPAEQAGQARLRREADRHHATCGAATRQRRAQHRPFGGAASTEPAATGRARRRRRGGRRRSTRAGVRCEAVPVNAGRRAPAAGAAGHTGRAVQVRRDAAHSGRPRHRTPARGQVEAGPGQPAIRFGKCGRTASAPGAAGRRSWPARPRGARGMTRDDVGRQLGVWMLVDHESPPVGADQVGSRRRTASRSGMRLSPASAVDGTARTPCRRARHPPGRRDPIADGSGGAGRLSVERPGATGGEQRHAASTASSPSWPSTQALVQAPSCMQVDRGGVVRRRGSLAGATRGR